MSVPFGSISKKFSNKASNLDSLQVSVFLIPPDLTSRESFRPEFLSRSALLLIFLMVRNGEGQSSHVLVFCVNFERHSCTHITTSIKCCLVSLRYVYVPFTYILCQSNWHVYISTNFQNVNKPSTLHGYLQKKFLASKSSLI